MTTTDELLMPNLWTSCNNNDIINNRILAQEQRSRIKKELYRIAEKELRESDHSRKQSLETLRDWIEKNPDVEDCLMDDNFLLRFLRVKKFSIPMAQQTLLKYLNFKNRFPKIMYELDYTASKSNDLIDNGYIFVSPFRDSYGRRVVVYDLSKLDTQRFDGNDLGKVHAITYETLLDDEENQILGINHVANVGAVGPQHATLFSLTEFAYLIRWGEQSFPMRHKDINLVNLPAPLKYIYDFAKSNMSPKLQERLTIHDSIDTLHQKVDRRCLPAEYGGKIPAKEMLAMWKEELAAKRQRLMTFDDIKLLSPRGIITRKNQPSQDDSGSLPGSFRKLELD